MDTRGASTNGMGLVGLRLRIGVVVGVFGRSHAPAGEKGKAAAIGNAIYSGDLAYTACALEVRGGASAVPAPRAVSDLKNSGKSVATSNVPSGSGVPRPPSGTGTCPTGTYSRKNFLAGTTMGCPTGLPPSIATTCIDSNSFAEAGAGRRRTLKCIELAGSSAPRPPSP